MVSQPLRVTLLSNPTAQQSSDTCRSSPPRHRLDNRAARLLPAVNRRSGRRMLDHCASDRPGKRMGDLWRSTDLDLP
jgi:hypothetical protein